ncbi:hypothetical protein E4U40_006483, partial [Claviceps sp. LM458 group G5]
MERKPPFLSRQVDWSSWIKYVQTRAKSLRIWDIIKPDSKLTFQDKPKLPLMPPLSKYKTKIEGAKATEIDELSAEGLKDYDRGQARYNTLH